MNENKIENQLEYNSSAIDEQPTLLLKFNELLKYMKIIDKNIDNSKIKKIEIIVIDKNNIKFKFIYNDESFIESDIIKLSTFDAFDLMELIEANQEIIVDINQENTKIEIHLDKNFINSLATKNELQLLANEVNSNGDTLNSLIGRVDNLTDSKQDKLIVNTGEATTELKSLNIDNVNYKLGGGGGIELITGNGYTLSQFYNLPQDAKDKIKKNKYKAYILLLGDVNNANTLKNYVFFNGIRSGAIEVSFSNLKGNNLYFGNGSIFIDTTTGNIETQTLKVCKINTSNSEITTANDNFGYYEIWGIK